jgi:hypothetical protein
MSEVVEPRRASGKGKKVALQLLLGMASGGFGMFACLWLLEQQSGAMVEPDRALAIGTALVFGLMALFVGLGTLAPAIGARTLNVEDKDELTEQRSNLLTGSVTFLLVAVFLAALALADSTDAAGLLARREAGVVALLTGGTLVAWSIYHRKKGDEMMRAAAREAGAITTNLLFLLFGTWAAAAHLGFLPMFKPLLFVAGLFALYLLAVFVAVAKRGLLKPR